MGRLGWIVAIGVGLLVVLVLATSFITPFAWGRGFGGYGWGMGPWMMGPGMMGGFGGFGFPFMGGIWMILFWALIIGGTVWLVQSLARGTGSSPILPQGESPLDILKKRYARGEITKEQFEGMKRDLNL